MNVYQQCFSYVSTPSPPPPRSAYVLKIGTESKENRLAGPDKIEKYRHPLGEILQNSVRVTVTNSYEGDKSHKRISALLL